jgi:hypothetical protein
LRLLNENLRAGVQVAFHDGTELAPDYWIRAQIKLDPIDPFVERDGAQVHGIFLVSEPAASPLPVELIEAKWLTKLARGFLPWRSAEPAPARGRAPSDEAQSPEEWLDLKQRETPQRGDKPSAYARRLFKVMPEKFRAVWTTWETLRVTLYKQRRAERRRADPQ